MAAGSSGERVIRANSDASRGGEKREERRGSAQPPGVAGCYQETPARHAGDAGR